MRSLRCHSAAGAPACSIATQAGAAAVLRTLALIAVLALAACGESEPRTRVAGGDAHRGAALVERYGCGSCHVVPGVSTAQGQVGPPLGGVAARAYVGGILPNTAENMVAWIRHPQQFAPRTAMPDLGIDEADGRHIAAYLYTLK
jgi:cytochrome c